MSSSTWRPARRVEYQRVAHERARIGLRLLVNRLDVLFVRRAPRHRDADLFAEDLELIHGGRPVYVERNEEGFSPLLLEIHTELRDERGLAGTLEPHHHDRRFPARENERLRFAAEQRGQFVMDDLDDLLGGREALEYVVAERPLLDSCDKILDDLVVHVRFEQRAANFSSGLLDVFFRNLSLIL